MTFCSWAHTLKPVPPLAGLNLIAHGSLRDITATNHRSPAPSIFKMTAEMLRVARDDDALRDLQWAALIPLELELLGSEGTESLDTANLLSSVFDAVESFREGSDAEA